jgi:hypothetical protein
MFSLSRGDTKERMNDYAEPHSVRYYVALVKLCRNTCGEKTPGQSVIQITARWGPMQLQRLRQY